VRRDSSGDRVAESHTLNALRYNGSTQQSYVVMKPSLHPNIPTLSSLAASKQTARPPIRGINAPQNWQANIGIDRQNQQLFPGEAQLHHEPWHPSVELTRRECAVVNWKQSNVVYPYGSDTCDPPCSLNRLDGFA